MDYWGGGGGCNETQWLVQSTVDFFSSYTFTILELLLDTPKCLYLLQSLVIHFQNKEAELNLVVTQKNNTLPRKEKGPWSQTACPHTRAGYEGCMHYLLFTQSSYFASLSLFSFILLINNMHINYI